MLTLWWCYGMIRWKKIQRKYFMNIRFKASQQQFNWNWKRDEHPSHFFNSVGVHAYFFFLFKEMHFTCKPINKANEFFFILPSTFHRLGALRISSCVCKSFIIKTIFSQQKNKTQMIASLTTMHRGYKMLLKLWKKKIIHLKYFPIDFEIIKIWLWKNTKINISYFIDKKKLIRINKYFVWFKNIIIMRQVWRFRKYCVS